MRVDFRDNAAQDLVEYSLMLAFICVVGAAMYIGMANSTTGIWNGVNSRLAACQGS